MTAEGTDQDGKATARRRSKGRPRRRPSGRPQRRAEVAADFYGSALDAAERIGLEAASDIEGLDGEIALLRMKLRRTLHEHPEDLQLMLRGIDLLVKAVAARYRLSKRAEEGLADSIAGVVRGVGGMLMPEAFSDE